MSKFTSGLMEVDKMSEEDEENLKELVDRLQRENKYLKDLLAAKTEGAEITNLKRSYNTREAAKSNQSCACFSRLKVKILEKKLKDKTLELEALKKTTESEHDQSGNGVTPPVASCRDIPQLVNESSKELLCNTVQNENPEASSENLPSENRLTRIRYSKNRPRRKHAVNENRRSLGWFCVCNPRVEFKNQGRLTEHIKYFNSDPKFVCQHCPFRTIQLSLLRKHLSTAHKKILPSGTTGCADCGEIFNSKQDHKHHRLTVHPRKSICETQEHGVDLKCMELNIFRCLCKRSFKVKNYLISHIRTYTNAYEFKCNDCQRIFRKWSLLQTHSRKVHKQIKLGPQFGCGECGEKYPTRKQHLEHCREAHGILCWNQSSDPPKTHGYDARNAKTRSLHRCLCGSGFRTKNLLTTHISSMGPRVPFKCPHCAVKFRYHCRLVGHIRKTHDQPDYQAFGCIKCGTSHATRKDLRRHQDRVHPRAEQR